MAAYHCRACLADIDEAVDGADIWAGVPVHLHDSGPGHGDLEVHPVHAGAQYSRLYTPQLALPAHPATGGLISGLLPDPPDAMIWADVSMWQPSPYTPAYGRRFAAYKATQGTGSVDPNASANTFYCSGNSGPGKQLIGHMGYHVWYPGNEPAQAQLFINVVEADACFVAMIDVESWGKSITGDHSAQITTLASLLAARFGQQRVKVYGNAGDLAQIYPTRPAWLGVIVASYGKQEPGLAHEAWQYTNGQISGPAGYPTSSAPFGPCDHNSYAGSADQLAAAFGIGPAVPSMEREDDMSFRVIECPGEPTRAALGIWAVGNSTRVHVPTPGPTGFEGLYLGLPECLNTPDANGAKTTQVVDAQTWDAYFTLAGDPDPLHPTPSNTVTGVFDASAVAQALIKLLPSSDFPQQAAAAMGQALASATFTGKITVAP